MIKQKACDTLYVGGVSFSMIKSQVFPLFIIVSDTIYDKFVEKVVEKAKAIKVGPYNEPGAEQGPQVDEIQFKKVMGYIEKGKAEGAKVATGGGRHGDKGYFVQPTVFTGK